MSKTVDSRSTPESEERTEPGIEVVLLRKKDGSAISKSYHLDKDGNLKATPALDLFNGLIATRIRLPVQNTLAALLKIINGLKKNDALALGRLPKGIPDGTEVPIVLSGQDGKGDHGRDYVHRTAEDFAYAKGVPAFVIFDFDVKSYPPRIKTLVDAAGGPWEAVLKAVPELRDVAVLKRPSTSTGIVRDADGHTFPGGGEHVYLLLKDGMTTEAFIKMVQDRLWEAGFGYARVVGGGRIVKWSIIDATIWKPQQPIYEAPPTLDEGLSQPGRIGQVLRGTRDLFDAGDLKPADEAEVARLFEEAKALPEVQAEVARKEAEWVEKRVSETGTTEEDARATLTALRDAQKVPLSTVLVPLNSATLGTPTVLDVLDDIGRWDGVPMADPIEGPDYGTQTAKVFANFRGTGRPKINSMAHGGILYELADYGVEDAVEAVRDGLDLVRVVKVLGLRQEAVRAVLAALEGQGTKVDAGARQKVLAQGLVESIARKAQAVLDFAEVPLPGQPRMDAGFVDGLKKIASKQKPEGAPGEVFEWLGAQKAALDLKERETGTGTGGKLWSPFKVEQRGRFPTDVFPAPLDRWVEEKAKSLGVEPGPLGVMLLGASGAAIHGGTRLMLKEDWKVPAALWIALVGDVSAKKSPVFSAALGKLFALTTENVRLFEQEVAKWEIDNDGVKKQHRSPFPLWQPHYVTADMTVEGLAHPLSKQDRGLCCAPDEIVTFIDGLGAYKKSGGGKDVGKMLSAFNGGPEVVHRASGGRGGGARTIAIDNWLVPVVGGIQPAKLATLGDAVVRNGLLERFLPALMGKAAKGSFRKMQDPDLWDRCLVRLTRQWPLEFSLSLDALLVFDEFLEDLYQLKDVEFFDEGVRGAVGKLDGVVGRIALNLHLIDFAVRCEAQGPGAGTLDTEVSAVTMENAVRLIREWAVPSLFGFWDAFVSGGGDGMIEQTARYLLRDNKTRYVASDFKANVRAMRGLSAWEINRALGQFEAGGWLTASDENRVGRYSWDLNPAVRLQFEAEKDEAESAKRKAAENWRRWSKA